MSQVNSSSSNPIAVGSALISGETTTEGNEQLSKFERPLEPAQKRQRKTDMSSDIEEMMYGFGDVWPPNPDSVNLVELLVIRYIEDLAQRAKEVSDLRGPGKMDKECFQYVVRKDRSKFSRVCQLLKANEELKTAQKTELKESNVN